jgi:hypothetical protein
MECSPGEMLTHGLIMLPRRHGAFICNAQEFGAVRDLSELREVCKSLFVEDYASKVAKQTDGR